MGPLLPTQFDGPVWLPTEPPSWETFLAPTLQPIPVIPVLGLLAAAAYLAGAIRVWASGRRWSPWATLSFLTGCAVLVVVMGAGVEGYGLEMYSVFMFQQLTLMMAVPPLLVLGRPGTLLLRATPHTRMGRPVLIAARWGLRSGAGQVVLHPALMIPLFLLCFYALYLSPLAGNLLGTWTGHLSLELLFLLAGILFTIPVLSRDPLPRPQGHLGRAADMFIEMPTHAFFGVIVMMASAPLVSAFTHPPATWGVDVLADQGVAGALAWSYGELPSLIMLLIIFVRWNKDETRRTRAADRRIDQYGDPELDAYNDYLRRLGDGNT
ncbi:MULTISPECIES: cytochrome c oxidase assembly protein [Cellulosimicrobium]|uniref:Cytochrome c oxidase assembly protein n=1 Tax=Cellulosimicrobium composti TaxID=2672572 RepID=A0A6N7ZLF4_9MICO|nr:MULTISPECIES: cytochrome c oxidase assembly protein [Cellulosimicrobium]MTG90246.1 cytochrome c oxidase assembly protein [Cellulosimicrobium composti]QUC01896.1 cytochrome c oxidase assembly protein [Cellulosimicrobium cellulans]